MCKEKISLWKDYFNSYDLIEKEPKDNSLNFVLTDAPKKIVLKFLHLVMMNNSETYLQVLVLNFLKMFNENFYYSHFNYIFSK